MQQGVDVETSIGQCSAAAAEAVAAAEAPESTTATMPPPGLALHTVWPLMNAAALRCNASLGTSTMSSFKRNETIAGTRFPEVGRDGRLGCNWAMSLAAVL